MPTRRHFLQLGRLAAAPAVPVPALAGSTPGSTPGNTPDYERAVLLPGEGSSSQ